MNRNWLIGTSWAVLALVGTALAGTAGCKSTPTEATGTETNWLMACERDAQCGDFSCLCGVCTTACDTNAQCSQENAVCGPLESGAAEALCGGADTEDSSETGICLRAGCTGADCVTSEPLTSGGGAAASGGSDTGGATNAGANMSAAGSQSAPGGNGGTSGSDTGGTSGSGGATSSAGSGGNGGGGASGTLDPSGVDVTDAITDPETTGTGACAGQSVQDVLDAIHAAAPELSAIDQLYSTEIFNDANTVYAFAFSDGFRFVLKTGSGDCPAGCIDSEYWYFQTDADCVPVEVGHYARTFNPTSNCYDITGAPLWDRPVAPSAASTCPSSECMVDGCRPDVCDEVGERCCDPAPGDGVNYCNAGLECSGDGCVAPAGAEEELCTNTGGTWEPNSCGNYGCGLAPNCDAIIPGCNCGIYRNFGDTGCVVDAACDTASMPFECGEDTCESVETQYCATQTGGAAGSVFYTCNDIPDACFAAARLCDCELLLESVSGVDCETGTSGEFIVTRPPAP